MVETVIRGKRIEQGGRDRTAKWCLRQDDVLNDLDHFPIQHCRVVRWDAVLWIDLGEKAE
jgi:hypothetical protein